MKKAVALLLALVLMLSLAACGSGNTDTSAPVSTPVSGDAGTAEFTPPENYALALQVTINPQVKLYLAETGTVLALQALNADAESFAGDIAYADTDYQTVIKQLITTANTKGFVKKDATVRIETADVKSSTVNAADILSKALAAAKDAAAALGITIAVNPTQKTDADSTTTTTAKPTANNNDSQGSTTAAHVHKYSKANCTEPAKCACGSVSGKALGHNWQPATCKAPKTCKTCGATEGSRGSHNFVNGTCTVCKVSNTANPKTQLKKSVEYVGNLHVVEDMLIGGALQFDDDVCVVVERYFNSVQSDPAQTPIVFEGKNYYSEGGGQTPHNYELTDSEIIVKGSLWADNPDAVTIKLVLQTDGLLKVTYSTDSNYPVGTVLSSNINDVLK